MLDLSRLNRFTPWHRLGFHLLAWLEGCLWGITYPLWMQRRPALRRRYLEYLRVARYPLPDIGLDQLVPSNLEEDQAVVLKSLAARPGNTSVGELFALALLAAVIKPHRALEIGTYDGRSGRAIALQLPPGGRLYTLNLPPDHLEKHPTQRSSVDAQLSERVTSGYRYHGTEEEARIIQWLGDSRDFDFVVEAPYQYIFIDGGHSYEVVMSDSRRALECIDRENGIILWHDATRFGVRRCLTALRRELPLHRISGTDLAVLKFHGGAPQSLEGTGDGRGGPA